MLTSGLHLQIEQVLRQTRYQVTLTHILIQYLDHILPGLDFSA
ncbi:hypothetical protein PPEP_a0491 [Pseudoalteromonas peptidolytica F12-50-A1]|uniref:Uncharacterized protein n=1 Tax=Pseudoalteromonas peptidolytica F12-50-A1 TaxID=1315280 RepID=A0A8I0T3Y7_9GAMM|nr:hypothetical protein [Pseudoalteromonas peptidolytica F12-50-A1]